jgi:hypothetical protein
MAVSKFAVIALMLLTLGVAAPVLAEKNDLGVARIRQDHPGAGFLFFDLTLVHEGKLQCTPSKVRFESGDQKLRGHFEIYRPNPLFSWAAESRGAMVPLLPGVWTLSWIECIRNMRTYDFNGPVAQIRMERDEIVNAGNLVLELSLQKRAEDFKPPVFGSHAKEEELSKVIVEAIKLRMPETFALAKRRHFTIVSSAPAH